MKDPSRRYSLNMFSANKAAILRGFLHPSANQAGCQFMAGSATADETGFNSELVYDKTAPDICQLYWQEPLKSKGQGGMGSRKNASRWWCLTMRRPSPRWASQPNISEVNAQTAKPQRQLQLILNKLCVLDCCKDGTRSSCDWQGLLSSRTEPNIFFRLEEGYESGTEPDANNVQHMRGV